MNPFAKEMIPVSLEEEMRRSYLDYAMSVIVGRALPDARDGLKPVHRRVLYAMHELNNDWNRPYKKSARIVGDVIGKYHPHGDTAVYDTIVRMAQDFSLRYMLVDGQGNFGSVDGDNAAAMRYTEIRLAKIANEMLADLDRETVDFGPNYDGYEREPLVLPTRLPNLLVNGSTGIAVGMATNIPPHNLREIVDACLHVLRDPDCPIDDLIEIVPAPDFPTGGIIHGIAGVREGYRTGRGRVVMRAKVHFEDVERGMRPTADGDHHRRAAVPGEQEDAARAHRASWRRRRSSKASRTSRTSPTSRACAWSSSSSAARFPRSCSNNLYKNTQLQDTFGMNMVALIDGQPRLLQSQDDDRGVRLASSRGRDAADRVRAEEGARTRPRARRSGGRAREHRRVHRADQGRADAADREAGADAARVGFVAGPRDAVARAGRHAGRTRRVPARGPAGALRDAGRRALSTVRRAGAGDPADAPAAAHRPRAGQDRRRVSRRDGPDRRPARHPREARAHHGDHRRRAGVDPQRVRRRAAQRDRDERPRRERRGPDHAAGHGRHAVARRLHQEPAGRRVPRRRSAAGGAGRRPRRRKTTGSTSSSSRTRTTSSSRSPTAAACTG